MILCCNDDVGLFAIGTDMLIPQHLQTVTLIMQHKPIERWTNMASISKKYQTQAWLKTRYWQRMTSKHVHAGRPGVPAPVMIKRNPIFHHLWRSEQYRAFAFFISHSKSDIHYQHILRVAAGLLALKSCSCCCCPLPFRLRLFLEPICKVFYCEGCVVFAKRPVCIPKYHFAKLSFCQNVILPEYHAAKIV
jgi:hypothetical protein